ncbi:50S ribosomal protein L3 [Candidatus Curtissbacteria bacterium]|nr:50S ribosomal protein L3 [Candidatus Curtissbacteria bacterium]
MVTVLGIKGNMSARYNQRGQNVPVTVLRVDPNVVIDIIGEKALLGIGSKKRVKKPQNNIMTKLGFMPRYMRQVKKIGELKIGDKITVALFSPQDAVKVTGITKGRGFAGSVKRWGFAGGPKTHGQSDRHRAPGSIGQTTTPGRVFKGKKMAGHLGNEKITVTGLEVIDVDQEKNQLFIKGAVPGAKNGFLVIEKTGKVRKYIAPPEEKPREEEESEEKKTEGTKQTEEPKEQKPEKPEEEMAKEQ